MKNKIDAKGFEVNILTQKNEDFISLTDIARYDTSLEPKFLIINWLNSYSTLNFLAAWENLNNPNFNVMEFHNIKNQAKRLAMSPTLWLKTTNAIGLKVSRGRNSAGTFAHPDIAFEFASWISPEFKLYIIKEYQGSNKVKITSKSLIGRSSVFLPNSTMVCTLMQSKLLSFTKFYQNRKSA